MAKRLKTNRSRRVQRSKSPTLEKPKPNKVFKPKTKPTTKGTTLRTPCHGMKTRARTAEVYNQLDHYQKHNLSSSPQTPQTPPLPRSTRPKRQNSIWSALSTTRSFWATVKEAEASSAASSFDSTNIAHIARRISASISTQLDSYKYEDYGFFSSSSPSGRDPRELVPSTADEVADLNAAVWPTVQHVLELTAGRCIMRLPNPDSSYLDQIRHMRRQLRDAWQDLGKPDNAPSPFQLESWSGSIARWRESTYTDGSSRFSAEAVGTQLELWIASIPPSPEDNAAMSDDDDEDDFSSPEIFSARHEWNDNATSPTLGASARRRPMSAIYDRERDVGFLPTAAEIHAYQAGTAASSTVPSLPVAGTAGVIDIDDFPPSLRRCVRIFEDRTTPPLPSADAAAADPAEGTGSGGEHAVEDGDGSDKENDVRVLVRQERVEREREPTPSSSQQEINPAGERMVRSELTGLEWEVERGQGWGSGGGGG
ncbi:MAG: hypothetical protein LQ348_005546 [Seirophora lacunosa]|nr:MAG: hypothetical protein LQ348_005546 [Seirophora lacunosa]